MGDDDHDTVVAAEKSAGSFDYLGFNFDVDAGIEPGPGVERRLSSSPGLAGVADPLQFVTTAHAVVVEGVMADAGLARHFDGPAQV